MWTSNHSLNELFIMSASLLKGMVTYYFNLKIPEMEAGEILWVWSQLGLQSEWQGMQGYTEKPCLENHN